MINIVLAAGYATRLYPLTENFPKALLEVAGEVILTRLIDDVDKHPTVTEHVIISNHRFIAHFERWAKQVQSRFKPIRLIDDGSMCNEDRLGAVKDLQFAIDQLQLRNDLFVMAGDNMLDFSLHGFINHAMNKQTSCVMCYEETEVAKRRKTAIITIDETDRILEYAEKPQQPKSDLAVPPFYCYRAADVELIGRAIAEGCPTDAPGSLAAWLSRKVPMHAWRFPEQAHRYDIGDMASYEHANRIFSGKA